MPRPSLRTRSKMKVFRRTPSGRTVVHYARRSYSLPRCGRCGTVIHGTDHRTLTKGPKSRRSVERPYGGTLCHRCLGELIDAEVLNEWGVTG
ncbi:MAG: 50S ribosomal protein L34e [Aigarchaeota archaeon]|nr:50S ribosomal protein L34e [Aigarchaeota archaeon]MDW8092927.1 50S ribosomal protein L34e [Nitrososphaerota archaeon]